MKKFAALFIVIAMLAVTLTCVSSATPRPNLAFDPLELPAAQVGLAYEATITISQNVTPVYWMAVGEGALPDGLTFEYHEHDSFAKIVGTPTATGAFKFSVKVACLATSVNGQTGQKEYVIEVK